jgi:hypothetical protein
MEVAESQGYDMAVERLPGRPLACMAIMLFFSAWVASLVGFVQGLVCLSQRRHRTKSAAWGAALNGLFFLGVLAFLNLNWEWGRPP